MIPLVSLWLAAAPILPQPALLPAPPPPLAVTMVLREGPPPYENDSSRLYRVEGEGLDKLEEGDILLLRRNRERRIMSRLEVTRVMPQYALARLAYPGETFPLRGDLAYPRGSLSALPYLPAAPEPLGIPEAGALQLPLTTLPLPQPEAGFTGKREPIHFLVGDSLISQAGQAKLQAWVKAWGLAHRWSLACPAWPGESVDTCAGRINTLKEALRHLGVTEVEVVILPDEAPGAFPVIYVTADPW